MSAVIQLNDDIFPANLIYLRKKRKLSQLEPAQKSEISVHYLRGIERGCLSCQLFYKDYQKLCYVLRISPTEMGTVLLQTETKKK